MLLEVFHLVFLYVSIQPSNVFCWELQDASKKLGREWSQELLGQNICADKYTFKERYFVCWEATKIVRKKGALINRLALGADSELRRIRCRERTVYFSCKTNGTYISANRMLYHCPVSDEDHNPFLFGQGKHRNEIGIYEEKRIEGVNKEIWFYGVMKNIDLDTFGKQLYRKNVRLIH